MRKIVNEIFSTDSETYSGWEDVSVGVCSKVTILRAQLSCLGGGLRSLNVLVTYFYLRHKLWVPEGG